MTGQGFKLRIAGLTKAKDEIARLAKRAKNLRPALQAFGENYMKRTVRDSIESGRNTATGEVFPSNRFRTGGGQKRMLDTGALLRSIVGPPAEVTRNSVSIGSSKVYARIHLIGGTVRPKTAKFLTIPLSKQAKRAGKIRIWRKQFADQQQASLKKSGRRRPKQSKARKFATSKIRRIPTKAGGWVIGVLSPNKKFTAHWLLTKKVVIPATPYLGWGRASEGALTNHLRRWIMEGRS